jgi:hypothetical protein
MMRKVIKTYTLLSSPPYGWMNKGFGGLGIPNLQDHSLCLIGSWMRTHIQGEGACGGKYWMMNTILIDQT